MNGAITKRGTVRFAPAYLDESSIRKKGHRCRNIAETHNGLPVAQAAANDGPHGSVLQGLPILEGEQLLEAHGGVGRGREQGQAGGGVRRRESPCEAESGGYGALAALSDEYLIHIVHILYIGNADSSTRCMLVGVC